MYTVYTACIFVPYYQRRFYPYSGELENLKKEKGLEDIIAGMEPTILALI
jgi:hypothetical protein